MSLVRYDLTQELDELRREVNRIFAATPARTWMSGESARWIPPMDSIVEDDQLVVSMDLPGIDQTDVDVQVDGDVLVVRGERSLDRERSDRDWVRFERAHGSFERRLLLPAGVDPARVSARFDRGVLEVRVPLPAEQEQEATHIQITGAAQG